MASRTLSVPKSLLPGLALIVQHREALSALGGLVSALPPANRSVQNITRQLSERLSIPLGDARQMILPLLSFHQLRETFGMSPPEAFEAITRSLEVDPPDEWKEKNLDLWRVAKQEVEGLLSTEHPLYFVQKSLRLKYEHANILRDASVLVDARPLFDASAKDVAQWAIDYVLQIEYEDGNSIKHLFATLDSNDITKLKEQCERALVKTETLKILLTKLDRPVVVTGEDEE